MAARIRRGQLPKKSSSQRLPQVCPSPEATLQLRSLAGPGPGQELHLRVWLQKTSRDHWGNLPVVDWWYLLEEASPIVGDFVKW